MGDVGEDYKIYNAWKKERKEENLSRPLPCADIVEWTEHTEFHFSCTVKGTRLDYWPSSDKFKYGSSMYIGGIEGFIKRKMKGFNKR